MWQCAVRAVRVYHACGWVRYVGFHCCHYFHYFLCMYCIYINGISVAQRMEEDVRYYWRVLCSALCVFILYSPRVYIMAVCVNNGYVNLLTLP